jgi:NTP pyrophosphatase (non-canonical NTP hydrolase)
MMTLNDYQWSAGKTNKGTALYVKGLPECGDPACDIGPSYTQVVGMYNILAMNGEAGETAEKVKKAARDGVKDEEAHRKMIGLELGDVLWYVSQAARDFGYTLEEIASMNLDKLRSREARGVLGGSGDVR